MKAPNPLSSLHKFVGIFEYPVFKNSSINNVIDCMNCYLVIRFFVSSNVKLDENG